MLGVQDNPHKSVVPPAILISVPSVKFVSHALPAVVNLAEESDEPLFTFIQAPVLFSPFPPLSAVSSITSIPSIVAPLGIDKVLLSKSESV